MTGHRAAHAAGAPDPLVYSVEQAADLLGIGRTFMFRLLATGEIESFKIGKRRKIAREALDRYIDRLRREQADGKWPPRAAGARLPGEEPTSLTPCSARAVHVAQDALTAWPPSKDTRELPSSHAESEM